MTAQSRSGWIFVAAAATIVCVGIGSLFSLGVFLEPMERATGWSRSGISAVALLNWVWMGVGSLAWGALSDRVGPRRVALGGGFLLGLGLVLSSRVTTLPALFLTFGMLVGLAVGAFYAPLTAAATRWFTANRGIAVALVSAGIGLGILLMSPLARLLITRYGWRPAMFALGCLAWLVVLPTALLLRVPPVSGGAGSDRRPGRTSGAVTVFRTRQFWTIALTHFACCSAHSGPIFHMVTHGLEVGLPGMAAAAALGASGLSSIAGRVGGGVLADRFGAKRTLIAGLGLQAFMIFLYLFARDLVAFYAVALVFGVAYGGVMPLYALITREQFGDRVMGAAYGGVFLVSTLGMGLGSFAGGFIHDHLGTYAWMFAASAGIGAGAVVIGLGLRSRPLANPAVTVAI